MGSVLTICSIMGLALWKMQKVRTDPNLTRYRSRKDRCRLQNGSYGLETDPIGSRKDRYRFENDPYRWQKIHSDRKTIGMDGKNDRYEPPRDPYHEKIQSCRDPNGLCRDPYGSVGAGELGSYLNTAKKLQSRMEQWDLRHRR